MSTMPFRHSENFPNIDKSGTVWKVFSTDTDIFLIAKDHAMDEARRVADMVTP